MSHSPLDFLAAKVEKLLIRTKLDDQDDNDDNDNISDELESLGYLRVIRNINNNNKNESDSSNRTNSDVIIQGRSEPDGEGKPFQMRQNIRQNTEPKLVYYSSSSSSSSEDEEEEKENVNEEQDNENENYLLGQDDISNLNDNIFLDNNFLLRDGILRYLRSRNQIPNQISNQIPNQVDQINQDNNPKSTSNQPTNVIVKNTFQNAFRQRSNSASNSTGVDKPLMTHLNYKSSNLNHQTRNDPVSIQNNTYRVRDHKQKLSKESTATGTQTVRSFLSEQAQHNKQHKQINNKRNKEVQLIDNTGTIGTTGTISTIGATGTIGITESIESTGTTGTTSNPGTTDKTSRVDKQIDTEIIIEDQLNHYQHDTNKDVNDNINHGNDKGDDNNSKKPLSWFIPFDKRSFSNLRQNTSVKRRLNYNSSISSLSSSPRLTLQEAFQKNCHYVFRKSQLRRERIYLISELRKRTAEQRLAAATKEFNEIKKQQEQSRFVQLPIMKSQLVCQPKRIFTHKQMREQTEKLYVRLPEVVAQKEKKKYEEKKRSRQIMAQVYKYTIKNYALKGRINWPITYTVV